MILSPADTKIEIEVYFRFPGECRIQIQDDRDADQFQQYTHRDCIRIEEDK